MTPGLIALMIPLFALGLGAMGIMTAHLEKMAKLRLQAGESGDARIGDEIKRLREELEALRSASTNFDLSFDERLDRLEARMSGVEADSAARRGVPVDVSENRTVGRAG